MGRIDNLNNFCTDIGAAIRTAESSTGVIPAAQFSDRIAKLQPPPGTWRDKTWTGGNILNLGNGSISINNFVTGAPIRISGVFNGGIKLRFESCQYTYDFWVGTYNYYVTNQTLPYVSNEISAYNEWDCNSYSRGAFTFVIKVLSANIVEMKIYSYWGDEYDSAACSGVSASSAENDNGTFTITSIQQYHS